MVDRRGAGGLGDPNDCAKVARVLNVTGDHDEWVGRGEDTRIVGWARGQRSHEQERDAREAAKHGVH